MNSSDFRLRLVVTAAIMSWLPATASAAAAALPLPPFEESAERKLAYDWVQIDSGEWLKGEIKRLLDEELYFDSDEFDDVSFDWEDVRTLVSKDVISLRLMSQEIITGRIEMRNEVARIYTDTGIRELAQRNILHLIPGTQTEKNYWSGDASINVSARSGNTNQADVMLRASITRQTVLTRWRTSYTGEFSTRSGKETANSHRVPSTFDVFLTSRSSSRCRRSSGMRTSSRTSAAA